MKSMPYMVSKGMQHFYLLDKMYKYKQQHWQPLKKCQLMPKHKQIQIKIQFN
jgi:hypothetical protein